MSEATTTVAKEKPQKAQKKEKELCGICADAYTAVLRRKIICKYCSKDACTKCIEQYLLSRPEDAHCIHCRVNYSDAVLKEICTKTYLQQTYFRHRQDILINRERANLPALQDTAQRLRRARAHDVIIASINEEIGVLRQQKTALVGRTSMLYVQSRERLKEGHDMTREQAELMQLTLAERELTQRMYRKRDEIMAIRRAQFRADDGKEADEANEANEEIDEKEVKEEKEEKKKFIRRCMKGGCQGFLSTAWKCGICEHYSCGKCFTVKGPNHDTPHTCKADDLATADMIRLDSKPCPSCGEFINKSSGCFGRDTPILLWDGTTKMSQDIREGDHLVGDDGAPRTVLALIDGVEELYEVSQTSGMTYVVNGAHTLVLKCSRERGLRWSEYARIWHIEWYSREEKKMKSKRFTSCGDVTKEIAYEHARIFMESLVFDEVIEMTVDEYLKLPHNAQKHMTGFKTAGIHWEKKEIPLDPYVMGLYIGDGINNGSCFAINPNTDPEILLYLLDWAKKNDCEIVHDDAYRFRLRRRGNKQNVIPAIGHGATSATCRGCKINKSSLCDLPNIPYEEKEEPFHCANKNRLIEILESYGLVSNKKSIPTDYLVNDRETRLQLLAGIIDTDGHVPKTAEGKRAVVITSLASLSEQIALLARSLGFITSIYRIPKKDVVFKKGGEKKDYPDHYGINISGQIEEIPTRIPRKKCRNANPRYDMHNTTISVKPVGLGEFYGWKVDGNHRFVLKDLTCLRNCSQIWCVTCKTPWDWNTGKIVTKGVIHNPHYYEWLRRNGGDMARNPADVPCGGFPNGYELRQVNRCASPRIANYFFEFHRLCMETQEHSERGFRSHLDQDGLQRVHVRFLLGDFEEKEWGRQLATAEKKRKRDTEIQEVFAAFRMVAVELLNRVQQYRDETVDTFTLLPRARADAYLVTWNEEVQELIQMVNEGMKAISLSYACSVPRIFVAHSNVTAYRLLSHKWVKAHRVTQKPIAKGTGHEEEQEQEQEEAQEQEEEEQEEEEQEQEEDGDEKEEVEDEVLRHVLEKSMKEM